jgi:hypothetical protein
VYEIVDLCPLLVLESDDEEVILSSTIKYKGPRVVCLSRLTPLVEHWANMYLTNPPTKEVDLCLHYTGGYARQYDISASRHLCCESGITIATILDAIYSEGLVEVTRTPGWWPSSIHDDMSGDRYSSVTLVVAELEERWAGQEWGCMMGGRVELDLSRTFIEIPEVGFQEGDEGDCYFQFGDGIRRYQVPAVEVTTAAEALQ